MITKAQAVAAILKAAQSSKESYGQKYSASVETAAAIAEVVAIKELEERGE